MATIEKYFEPETQDAFWKALTPDVRGFLDDLEKRESWTYSYNEFSDLFTKLASALPDIVKLPLEQEQQEIIHKLIPVLLSMPLRQCISAVAYLDRYGSTETNPVGWGVVCYLESAEMMREESTPQEQQVYFRIFCGRVQAFLHRSICVDLFIHLNKEVMESVND